MTRADGTAAVLKVWFPHEEAREAYTALGYLAACTSRIELLAWVTAVPYREPSMLASKF